MPSNNWDRVIGQERAKKYCGRQFVPADFLMHIFFGELTESVKKRLLLNLPGHCYVKPVLMLRAEIVLHARKWKPYNIRI